MVKVLIASKYESPNIYVKSIVDHLQTRCEVVCSKQEFWESENRYDVVHIQWTEELFDWQIPTSDLFDAFKKRIQYWQNHQTKIVLTRHNAKPHRQDEIAMRLYEWIFNQCDAVVHLGSYSLEYLSSQKAVNVVIEHPNYLDFYEAIPTSTARQKLKFPPDGKIYLSFGVIRDVREEMQAIEAFKQLAAGSHLYIGNSKLMRNKPKFNQPIAFLKHKLKVASLRKSNIHLLEGRIDNNDLKYYFNAADVVITPRIDSLNSGVAYMAFSFGKPVVGPDIGNIGPLLKQNGNPVFVPNDAKSMADAMRQAAENADQIGMRNMAYAKTQCDPEKIAAKHADLYYRIANKA